MMDTTQIDIILRCDYMTKHLFQGVFPIDMLPARCSGMYVINTDEHDKPGEHWIAVYDNEYFDSFGVPPQDERLEQFMGYDVVYNTVELQKRLTNSCGFYCIYYLLERARGNSMDEIVHVLKNSDGDFVVKNRLYECYRYLFY